jgi:hypothetical protein
MVVGYFIAAFAFGYSLDIQQPFFLLYRCDPAVIAFISFGLIIAPIFVMNPGVRAWQNAMEFPVYVLCGFLFPIALLPGWTTPISYLLPPYWAAVALHGTSTGGASLQPDSPHLGHDAALLAPRPVHRLAPVQAHALQSPRRCNAWDGMKTFSNNLRLFWQGALLSYIALFHWMRPIQYMASKILMPLAQMFFFVYLGPLPPAPTTPRLHRGQCLQIAAVSGIYGMTMSIGGDRDNGTLGYIFGTPANRLVVFMGRAFMNIMDGTLGVVIAFTWGVVLMGLDLSNTSIPALALTILITTISTCGLGMLLGCLS